MTVEVIPENVIQDLMEVRQLSREDLLKELGLVPLDRILNTQAPR